MVKIKKA